MHYCGINKFDTSNGEGIRVSLFVSGCSLHCKGCHNKEAWDFNYGEEFTDDTLETLCNALGSPYIDGLTILGGDPLEPENVPVVASIIDSVRSRFKNTKTIWLYTGRRYEKVKDLPMMSNVDVIVDGPFVEAKKVIGKFYGSSNQRIIKIKEI